MESPNENIRVIFDSMGGILIELDGSAIELTRAEAEQLFVDIGHALQDQDMMRAQYEAEGKLDV